MIYVNKLGIPHEISNHIIQNEADRAVLPDGEYSVTEILNPPRVVHLTRRYFNNIKIDVSTLLYSFMGKAIHDRFQTNYDRFCAPFKVADGIEFNLSGEPDIIDIDHFMAIRDLKVTTVWSIIFGSNLEKWEQQLNCYAYLVDVSGSYEEKVKSLQIIVWFRDWSETQTKRDWSYPKKHIYDYSVKLWGKRKQLKFIQDKLRDIYLTLDTPDDELPLCSDEDRWISVKNVALMKKGRRTAIKLFKENNEEIAEYAEEKGIDLSDEDYYIETRKTEPRRCMKYCVCNQFCNQYKEYLEERRMEDDE